MNLYKITYLKKDRQTVEEYIYTCKANNALDAKYYFLNKYFPNRKDLFVIDITLLECQIDCIACE